MSINQEWKIKARAHTCCVTGRAFKEDEPFFTALFEDNSDDGFERRDYSVEAWKAERGSLKPFSYWRTLYEPPRSEPQKQDVVEKESAEGLLRRLIDEDDPLTENTRFILALMLERKKTLRETDSRSLGQARLRIYEHARSGEVFIIRDPMLKLDQLESIQEEVSTLLAARAAAPPEPAEPAEPAEPMNATAPAETAAEAASETPASAEETNASSGENPAEKTDAASVEEEAAKTELHATEAETGAEASVETEATGEAAEAETAAGQNTSPTPS